MMTVKDALHNTKSGTPYKFFCIETGADLTEKIVFNLSKYNDVIISKMIMMDNKIFYFI